MSDPDRARRARVLHAAALVAILLVAVGARVYQFRGFGASDDAAYAEIAGRLARGEPFVGAYDGPAVFPLRVGIIHPTAVLFRTFGVHRWTMAGFPFLVSLLGVVLAYGGARHVFGPRAGLIAAGIWSLLPIDAFQASVLAPDLPAAVALGGAVLLVLWLLSAETGSTARWFGGGAVAGLLLGYSWLTKETVAYAAPFFLFLIAWERRRFREIWGLWAGIAVASGAVLVGEAAVYRALTGDWLFHLHETERNYQQYPNAFAVERLDGGDGGYLRAVVKRLVYTGPWAMLLNPRLGYLPLIGAVATIHGLLWRDRRYLLPAIWLASLALMFNFASSSTREYVPLVLFDRYLYPLLMPASILAAGLLSSAFRSAPGVEAGAHRERAFWCTSIALFMLATFAFHNREYRYFNPGWDAETRAVAEILEPTARVYTDAHSIFGLDFYWAYPDEFGAVNFEGMATADAIPAGAYVLVNRAYLDHLQAYSGWWPTNSEPYSRPPFVDAPPPTWETVWSGGNGTLYAVR